MTNHACVVCGERVAVDGCANCGAPMCSQCGEEHSGYCSEECFQEGQYYDKVDYEYDRMLDR